MRRRGRPPYPDILTPAKRRVVDEVRRGLTNPEIAERLGISVNTVRYHVSNVLAKLQLPDRHALRRWRETRRRWGLVPLLGTIVAGGGATVAVVVVVSLVITGLRDGRSRSAAEASATETPTPAPQATRFVPEMSPHDRAVYEATWWLVGADGWGKTRSLYGGYTMRAGDTLGSLARAFELPVRDLELSNPSLAVSPNALLPADTPLRIPPGPGIVHTVAAGETMSSLAHRYGVAANDIVTPSSSTISGQSPVVTWGDIHAGSVVFIPQSAVPQPTP